jgi:hypothetical protein
MAQTLSINEAQTLVSDLLDEVWEAEKPPSAVYTKYMNVKSMDRGEHVDYRIAGLGKFQERAELEDIDYDDITFGEKLTVRPKNWARGFRVSEEVIEDLADSGGRPDGDTAAKLGTYTDIVKRWKRSVEWTVEQECADMLLNGTSTAAEYVLRDSIALFGSHVTLKNPTVTQSNLNTHASLSATQIDNMSTAIDLQLDDRGDYLNQDGKLLLIVSATDASKAYEIINTKGQVDTANNNVNRLNRRNFEIIENRYLNVLAASYSGYFLLREGSHSLTWLWRKKAQFKQDSDFDAVAMKFRGRFRGVRFAKDYRGTIGDNGS